MHAASTGFMVLLTLYGPTNGTPSTMTSLCPCTGTSCWRWTAAMVFSWTASTSPATTPVSP